MRILERDTAQKIHDNLRKDRRRATEALRREEYNKRMDAGPSGLTHPLLVSDCWLAVAHGYIDPPTSEPIRTQLRKWYPEFT